MRVLLRLTVFEIAVAVLGAVLDIPRFFDIGFAIHGGRVTWAVWPLVHGITTALFSVVFAASLILCFNALAKRQNRAAYWVLLCSTVALVLATGVAVSLALLALGDPAMHAWFVIAAVVAPLLVVMNVPLAASLRDEPVVEQKRVRSRTVTVTDEGVTPVETEQRPALPAGIPLEQSWIAAWNDTPAERRSLRGVAAGLGVTHTRLRRVLLRAGVLEVEHGNDQ